MNPEQAKSAAGVLLAFLAGSLGGYGVNKNWFTAAQLTGFITNETVISVTGLIVITVWRLIAHTQKNAVAVVDAIAKQPDSPVKAVLVEPTPEGLAIASSLPGTTTVPAGTAQAVRLAKDEPVRNIA